MMKSIALLVMLSLPFGALDLGVQDGGEAACGMGIALIRRYAAPPVRSTLGGR